MERNSMDAPECERNDLDIESCSSSRAIEKRLFETSVFAKYSPKMMVFNEESWFSMLERT